MSTSVVEVVVAGAVLAISAGVLYWVLRQTLVVCGPHEIVVVSGRQHRRPDGSVTGYRVVAGGRAVVLPLLERVDRLSTALLPVSLEVRSAYGRDGDPIDLNGTAEVRVSQDATTQRHAIERFLGRPVDEIAQVAGDVLEGQLRRVLATVTVDEARQDQLVVVQAVLAGAEQDRARLGLEVEGLQIGQMS